MVPTLPAPTSIGSLDEYRRLMSEWFGYSELRSAQEAALAALEERDVFTVSPTGSGKSMNYVLPALKSGKTLVVSPHIALMQDQVESLHANGVPAAFINSTLSAASKRETYIGFRAGDIRLLFTSPESLGNDRFVSGLSKIGLNLLAIDEAHCVSEWGHTFRPDYLRLREIRERLGRPRTLALTATATPRARADIVTRLGLDDAAQIVNSVSRPNLVFSVRHAASNEQKRELLIQLVRERKGQSGIVYVGARKRTEELAEMLADSGVSARPYHAGLDAETRRITQRSFMVDETEVIVATSAFGLGVDKPDVRFVIHFDMPARLEAYYQEAGRAGRDGDPATCELIYTNWSRKAPEFFIDRAHPDDAQVRQIWQELLRASPMEMQSVVSDQRSDGVVMAMGALQVSGLLAEDGATPISDDPLAPIETGVITRHMHYELEMLASMVEFATTPECRVNVVLRYFGEEPSDACGRCDNCTESRWQSHAGRSRKRSGERKSGSLPQRIHMGDPDFPLFDALRDWRADRAREDGVPAFVIFHDRTLVELARRRPSSMSELLSVPGVGATKRDRYGQDLIQVVRRFS